MSAQVVPLALARPRIKRRYLVDLAAIRRGKVDSLSETINDASSREPELRALLDSKASGIVFSPSLEKYVVLAVGKGKRVSVTPAATREAAERQGGVA